MLERQFINNYGTKPRFLLIEMYKVALKIVGNFRAPNKCLGASRMGNFGKNIQVA